MEKENIFILSSGDVLELDKNRAGITGRVPVGAILVDGLGVGDVGNVVLRDRQHLAEDGIMVVVMSLDRVGGELVAGPDIVSRGFVYVKESDELIEEARQTSTTWKNARPLGILTCADGLQYELVRVPSWKFLAGVLWPPRTSSHTSIMIGSIIGRLLVFFQTKSLYESNEHNSCSGRGYLPGGDGGGGGVCDLPGGRDLL